MYTLYRMEWFMLGLKIGNVYKVTYLRDWLGLQSEESNTLYLVEMFRLG